MVETEEMSVGHSVALSVPEPSDGLVEPDGDVHRQDLPRQGLHPHWFTYGLQQCPQTQHTHSGFISGFSDDDI